MKYTYCYCCSSKDVASWFQVKGLILLLSCQAWLFCIDYTLHDFAFVCLFFPLNFHINNFFSALFPVIFYLDRVISVDAVRFNWCWRVNDSHIFQISLYFFLFGFFFVRFFSFLFCRVTHGLSIHQTIHTHDFYYCKAFLWLSNRMLIWMSV